MIESGELPTELANSLSTEQLILTEAPVRATRTGGKWQCANSKVLFLKLRTQRLKKLGATQARQRLFWHGSKVGNTLRTAFGKKRPVKEI